MSFLSPEEMRLMLFNADDSIPPAIYISSTVCAVATFLAVVLRVFARLAGGSGFGRDDYFLGVGWVFYMLYIIGFSFSARYTNWDHSQGLIITARAYARHIIVNLVMYHTAVTCVKLSILFLYRRIFPSRRFLVALYTVGGLVLAWFITSVFIAVFHCFPLSMAWDPSVEGHCINLGLASLLLGIANILIDFVMLGLPLPLVWRLQMETRKKMLLGMTFLAGGLACIVSMVRLFYASRFARKYDPGWDAVVIGILSGLEVSAAIIASCTVTFRPLIEKIFKGPADARLLQTKEISSSSRWGSFSEPTDVEAQPGILQPSIRSELASTTPRTIVICILFLILTAALPGMLQYSQSHNGLGETKEELANLWRFGPTAVLTILGVFWSRVEFQALRYMPWLAIYSQPYFDFETLDLDYRDLLLPQVLLQSLQRKHYLVFFVSIVMILLRIQVVLSPSLFELAKIRMEHPIEVQLLDSFPDPDSDLAAAVPSLQSALNSSSPSNGTAFSNDYPQAAYFFARATQDFETTLPFGVTGQFAYQRFSPAQATGAARGTPESPIKAVVDGIFTDVECLNLESYIAKDGNPSVAWSSAYDFTMDLRFENCNHTFSVRNDLTNQHWIPSQNKHSHWVFRQEPETYTDECPSLLRNYPPFLYYAAYYSSSSESAEVGSLPKLDGCAAILCSPRAWLAKVEVTDDGMNPNVTVLPNQEQTFFKSDFWNVLQQSVPEASAWYASSTGEEQLDEDTDQGPILAAFNFKGQDLDEGDPSLYRSSTLTSAIRNLTDSLSPMVAHYMLRQSSNNRISGSTTKETQRLQVNREVSITMSVLFAACTLICLWVVWQMRKVSNLWHRDPATIMGSLTHFHSDTYISKTIDKYLADMQESRSAEWSHGSYTQLALRPLPRISFVLFTFSVIVGLTVSLHISNSSEGLATVDDSGFISQWWRSLPALAMLVIALYATAVDTAMRDLATLSDLSSKSSTATDLDRSLSDMMGINALFHSLRLKTHAVSISQVLAMLCGILVTTSALLFTVESVPGSSAVEVPQQSWFGSRAISGEIGDEAMARYRHTRANLGGFIAVRGMANFSYPKNTYADMVFPLLDLNDTYRGLDTSIQLTVPAAKLLPTCVQIPSEDMNIRVASIDFGIGISQESSVTPVEMTLNVSCPDGTTAESTTRLDAGSSINGSFYVAGVLPSPGNLATQGRSCLLNVEPDDDAVLFSPWRVETYAWGKFAATTDETGKEDLMPDYDYFSVWQCNYSWAEVTVDMKMEWANGEYLIDQSDPPRVTNTSVQPWSPPFAIPHFGPSHEFAFGDALPNLSRVPGTETLSAEFYSILEPNGRVPLQELGEPGHDDKILDAIHSNNALICAQLANVENRLDLNETSPVASLQQGGLTPVPVIITNGRRTRLVQNAAPTYIIISILALALVANIWALLGGVIRRRTGGQKGWLVDMEMGGLAPSGYNSIAMMHALLSGSNAPNHMPPNASLLSSKRVAFDLGESRFKLGWFTSEWTVEKHFTVGLMNDDNFTFQGGK
ncbi:hypothetical protein B0I35DRAFT_515107 [Stachybotrys elegans]|uniref:Rhodopsin domain-containing protein n=1 Tax=Stachybotrys elegans TaxID=80388 RepID=A0A8K0SJB3_9HYPO|nr:hypothetical protein B0I35DRAFT_515107 [Stachybotrys elegans]